MAWQQERANSGGDPRLLERVIRSLDEKHALAEKMAREPEIHEVITEFVRRLERTFGRLSELRGKRILDLGCGSRTSRDPRTEIITPLFEPWFCRILVELGTDAVGVDLGELDGEAFEHYRVDLAEPGSLDFLPDSSFDGVHDNRIFGSPEFTSQHPSAADYQRISQEIKQQERRLLKPGGVVIHSDVR